MTNVETTDTAATVAAQGAGDAPEQASSTKTASRKKGAPKGQKGAKSAKPKALATKKAAKTAKKTAKPGKERRPWHRVPRANVEILR